MARMVDLKFIKESISSEETRHAMPEFLQVAADLPDRDKDEWQAEEEFHGVRDGGGASEDHDLRSVVMVVGQHDAGGKQSQQTRDERSDWLFKESVGRCFAIEAASADAIGNPKKEWGEQASRCDSGGSNSGVAGVTKQQGDG